MDSSTEFANLASLFADPTRSEMLLAMMDGRAFPVSELAAMAHVSLPTASHHLAILVEGGIVDVLQQGRHRYHRLAGPHVASLIEQLAVLANSTTPIRKPTAGQRLLMDGRVCYNHLAGHLGVGLRQSLEVQGQIQVDNDRYVLTESGMQFFADFGLDLRDQSFGKLCLDWTERVPHIGGKLGSALFQLFLQREWIARGDIPRQIRVTKIGKARFHELFQF